MADVKLRIEVNPNAETERLGDIVNVGGSGNLSNVSYKLNADNEFVVEDSTRGREMLSFASGLRFNSEGLLTNETSGEVGLLSSESEPDMFVWGAVPSTGMYSVKLTFTNATALKDIIVYGDPTTQQFPTRAIVDGTREITSDDYRWAINLGTESTTHTIEFTHWNRPNYNACLTKIMVMLRYYDVGIRNGLKNIDSISQSTGQPKEVHYGVIANSGSANVVDVQGEILDMINDGIIPKSNVFVDVFVNGNKIQSHIINDSDYSPDKNYSIELTNNLEKLHLYYDGYKNIDNPCTLYDLIVDVFQSLDVDKYTIGYIDNMLLGADLKQYTSSIRYASPFISYAPYSEVINNICNVAQMSLMTDDAGNIRFVNARVDYNASVQPIVIPANRQQGLSQKDIILKNEIQLVECNPSNLIKEFETPITTENVDFDWSIQSGSPAREITLADYNYSRYTTALGMTITQGARVEGTVANGSFEFRKVPNIIKVYEDVQYKVSGVQGNDMIVFAQSYSTAYDPKALWESTTSSFVGAGGIPLGDASKPITEPITGISLTYSPNDGSGQTTYDTLSISHQNSVTLTEYEDKYVVSYSILVRASKFFVLGANQELDRYECQDLLINSLSFTVNGDKVEIRFTDKTFRIGDEKSPQHITLPRNEMFQTSAKINNTSIAQVIGENLLTTHQQGVSTCRLTIQCGDMYYADGTKAKDWSMGQVLQVNDVVRIDKDNDGTSQYTDKDGNAILWRVTGRTFHYEGVPTIDLELQEIIT